VQAPAARSGRMAGSVDEYDGLEPDGLAGQTWEGGRRVGPKPLPICPYAYVRFNLLRAGVH
jgi:hypothetical protein